MQQDQARSIKRTLEVLEYFDADKTCASVSEISRELGYPQSSTSILLKSLLNLGYLAYDNRTYRPTARVALLGRGIRSQILDDGNLMATLEEVSQRTGEMIFLASTAGLSVHYIYVIPATNPLRMHLRAGAVRSMAGSSTGHLFLSAKTDAEIAKIVERASTIENNSQPTDLEEVMKAVRKIRKLGCLLSTKTLNPGGGVLAKLLPQKIDGQPLAICIGGVGSILVKNFDQYSTVMENAITRHLSDLP